MGWKNQVICQLKGNAPAPYGEGASFSNKIYYHTYEKTPPFFFDSRLEREYFYVQY